jgi:DNA polymerase-3 subunit epsilon
LEFEGLDFLAAHNASFDRSVLETCCERARVKPPSSAFECTVRLARSAWDIRPTTLPDVCRRLRIPLHHHDAGSDAEACARIVIAAAKAGVLSSSPPLPDRRVLPVAPRGPLVVRGRPRPGQRFPG